MSTLPDKDKLRPSCLNFPELLAQNIALISPTMTAALIVPLMFSNSGNMSWFSFALGSLMLLFVALNLNAFAKRSATTVPSCQTATEQAAPEQSKASTWRKPASLIAAPSCYDRQCCAARGRDGNAGRNY